MGRTTPGAAVTGRPGRHWGHWGLGGTAGTAGARDTGARGLKLEARHDADAAARQQKRAPQGPRHNAQLPAAHTVKLAHLSLRRKVRRNPSRGPDQHNPVDDKAPLGTKKLQHRANNRKNHQRRRSKASGAAGAVAGATVVGAAAVAAVAGAAGGRKKTLPPRVNPTAERVDPRTPARRTPQRVRPVPQVPEALPNSSRKRRTRARSPPAPFASLKKPLPLRTPHRNPRGAAKKVPHRLAHLGTQFNTPRTPHAPAPRRLGARGRGRSGGAGAP